MEKRFETKPASQEPLRPVVVPIPDPVVPQRPLPAPLERLLSTAAINRATELLLERGQGKHRIRERIRGVLITDLRAVLTEVDIGVVFEFVMKAVEPRRERGLVWADLSLEIRLNNDPYLCRFLLSETKGLGVLSIHLSRTTDRPFNPTSWGMGPSQAQSLENFLGRSHGLVLFCGTDTDDITPHIQSCTKQLATPERHVISVSARPEAWFAGVEQLVSDRDDELFGRLLGIAFKHEPDLVVADPVTRKEHISICMNEALRGRLVFARMHATDVTDALLQILSMGIEPYVVGAALMGVVAQRTLRLNCQKCQDKDSVSRDRLKDLGIPIGMQPSAFFRGKGCEACFKTGFDRETNIFEVVEMNDDLRSRLTSGVKAETFRTLMKNGGLMTLRQVALHKAINGQTSLSEVFRTTPQ